MNELENNKAILLNMTERDVGNIYNNLKGQLYKSCPKQFQFILNNYIQANENKWIKTIDNYIDIAIENSFPNETTTLEEAILNMNTMINDIINVFIQEKLKIDPQTLGVAIQLLLGKSI